ncbi:MAG: ATP-binding protein [Vulcanimicrobiaceae bacterium]
MRRRFATNRDRLRAIDGGRVFFSVAAGVIVAFALGIYLATWHIHHPFVALAFFSTIFLLSLLVARLTTRPLDALASAAARLGDDVESAPPLPERGPTEVRQAAAAFNAMQARIGRDVRERMTLLAAITHDLQTPLTRLRLRLEKVGDEALRAKLVADLDAMRETVREGLDLATSLDTREAPQRIDLDSMLESVVADAVDAGADVTLQGRTGRRILGWPNALRRCLTNLVDNAVAYGGYARVRGESGGGRVFDPFVRVEGSRSRETGGTGLGLTIARNAAANMGGTIALRNHPEDGLEVRLVFPAADR